MMKGTKGVIKELGTNMYLAEVHDLELKETLGGSQVFPSEDLVFWIKKLNIYTFNDGDIRIGSWND
jgi:hypothetical protein